MPESDGFLDVPARSPKPRRSGLTHVIDKGLNLREIEGLFDTAGDYIDVVKLGWGTSYVAQNLTEKIALYRSFETPVICGGTLFEAAVARGRLDEYRRWLVEHADTHMTLNPVAVNYQCWAARRATAHIAADGSVEYDREA